LGDGLGFVERRPSADAGDEVLVFLLIRVYVLLPESPELSVSRFDVIRAVARTLRAHHCLADFALAAIHLPALAEHSGATGVLELDGEMVVDVTLGRTGPRLASTQCQRLDGMVVERPVDDVQVVHMLFDDVIPGKPREIVPVPELPFHVAPAVLPLDDPDRSAIPISAHVTDIANGAVVQALDGL